MNLKNIDLPKNFTLIVALLVSISPLAIDTYLAAFTQMSIYYNTSINMIEITLSVYLFGYGIGQLFGGPLADKHGRKSYIILGIIIYSISSISIIFTKDIEYFWALRIVQAFGTGFVSVNAISMIRDLYRGKEAAKVMSVVGMVMMIAPILAPIIGTTILNFTTWHYIFVFLAVYSLFTLYFVRKLPETSSKNRDHKLVQNYKKVLSDKVAILLMIAGSFSYAGLFIFITKSSFMYMELFNFTPNEFTLIYSANVMLLVVFSAVNMKLLKIYSTYELLFVGIFLQLVLALILLVFYPLHNIYSITILMMLFIASLGFIFANNFSLILEKFHSLSGTANALNGVMNSILAAFMAFLSSFFHDGTLLPVFIIMAVSSSVSFVIVFFYKKEIKKLAQHE